MDANLIRNGYNLERRKMYIQNPRHNLRSSVDFLWKQSLQQEQGSLSRKKEISKDLVKQQYNRLIDKKLEDELKLNKSSFRVMPSQQQSPQKNKYNQALNKQIIHHNQLKKSAYDSPTNSVRIPKKSESFSKSVFGYDIDHQGFKRQSYLSKVLGDRLGPYLKKQIIGSKHQSFTINQPVELRY